MIFQCLLYYKTMAAPSSFSALLSSPYSTNPYSLASLPSLEYTEYPDTVYDFREYHGEIPQSTHNAQQSSLDYENYLSSVYASLVNTNNRLQERQEITINGPPSATGSGSGAGTGAGTGAGGGIVDEVGVNTGAETGVRVGERDTAFLVQKTSSQAVMTTVTGVAATALMYALILAVGPSFSCDGRSLEAPAEVRWNISCRCTYSVMGLTTSLAAN